MIQSDCIEGLKSLESNSIDCIITSPPYNKNGLQGKTRVSNQVWKKCNIDYTDYNDDLPEEDYQAWMIELLDECHRVIKPAGSIFFNHKPRRHKNQAFLPTDFISKSAATIYQLIIWDRRNSPNIRNDVLVPSTEHIYWLRKDKPSVFREQIDPSFRTEVWSIPPDKQKSHPAPFPKKLVENCINLSTRQGAVVLDPFVGSGTSGVVATEMGRQFIGFDIDPFYLKIAQDRINSIQPSLPLNQPSL